MAQYQPSEDNNASSTQANPSALQSTHSAGPSFVPFSAAQPSMPKYTKLETFSQPYPPNPSISPGVSLRQSPAPSISSSDQFSQVNILQPPLFSSGPYLHRQDNVSLTVPKIPLQNTSSNPVADIKSENQTPSAGVFGASEFDRLPLISNSRHLKREVMDTHIKMPSKNEILLKESVLIEQLFIRAEDSASKGDYKNAINYYEKITDINSEEGIAWTALGHCYILIEDFQKAFVCYQKALYSLTDVRDPQLWYGIGLIYDKFETYEYAIPTMRCVLKLSPYFLQKGEVYYKLGVMFGKTYQLEQAIFHFRLAERDPTFSSDSLRKADILAKIGICYMEKNMFSEALCTFQLAASLNDKNFRIYQHLSWCEFNLMHYASALAQIASAIRLKKNDCDNYYIQGRILLIDRTYEAQESLKLAIDIDHSKAIYLSAMGILNNSLQQYEEAFDNFLKATNLDKNMQENWYNIGVLYEIHEQFIEAEAAYQKALEINPEFPEALTRKALVCSDNPTAIPIPPLIHPRFRVWDLMLPQKSYLKNPRIIKACESGLMLPVNSIVRGQGNSNNIPGANGSKSSLMIPTQLPVECPVKLEADRRPRNEQLPLHKSVLKCSPGSNQITENYYPVREEEKRDIIQNMLKYEKILEGEKLLSSQQKVSHSNSIVSIPLQNSSAPASSISEAEFPNPNIQPSSNIYIQVPTELTDYIKQMLQEQKQLLNFLKVVEHGNSIPSSAPQLPFTTPVSVPLISPLSPAISKPTEVSIPLPSSLSLFPSSQGAFSASVAPSVNAAAYSNICKKDPSQPDQYSYESEGSSSHKEKNLKTSLIKPKPLIPIVKCASPNVRTPALDNLIKVAEENERSLGRIATPTNKVRATSDKEFSQNEGSESRLEYFNSKKRVQPESSSQEDNSKTSKNPKQKFDLKQLKKDYVHNKPALSYDKNKFSSTLVCWKKVQSQKLIQRYSTIQRICISWWDAQEITEELRYSQ